MQNSKRRIITQTTKREKLTQQIQFKNNSKFQKQQHQSDTREKTVLATKKTRFEKTFNNKISCTTCAKTRKTELKNKQQK